jgi:H+/Cl- antiporter ClcA
MNTAITIALWIAAAVVVAILGYILNLLALLWAGHGGKLWARLHRPAYIPFLAFLYLGFLVIVAAFGGDDE